MGVKQDGRTLEYYYIDSVNELGEKCKKRVYGKKPLSLILEEKERRKRYRRNYIKTLRKNKLKNNIEANKSQNKTDVQNN